MAMMFSNPLSKGVTNCCFSNGAGSQLSFGRINIRSPYGKCFNSHCMVGCRSLACRLVTKYNCQPPCCSRPRYSAHMGSTGLPAMTSVSSMSLSSRFINPVLHGLGGGGQRVGPGLYFAAGQYTARDAQTDGTRDTADVMVPFHHQVAKVWVGFFFVEVTRLG